jgi:hypothetical protein
MQLQLKKANQPYPYKRTNTQPTTTSYRLKCSKKALKRQICPKNMAVQKENPTKQGLKRSCR